MEYPLIDKAIRERNYAQVSRCKMLFIRFESILTKQIRNLLELALSCPDEAILGWVFCHFPAYRLSDSRWVLEHAVKRGKSIDLILALDRACTNIKSCPSALRCLAIRGHEHPNAVDMLHLLLDSGVDVDVQDMEGMTALMCISNCQRKMTSTPPHQQHFTVHFLEALLARRP